jgi:hypothetical protein
MHGRLSRRRARLRFTVDRTSAARSDGPAFVGGVLLLFAAVVVVLVVGRFLGLV